MASDQQYRYPGIYSFTSDQNSVFFGRQEDIKKLLTLIEVESEVLLYAKSGIGKTSLLNAGIFPRLPNDHLPLLIRFYAAAAGQKKPLETLFDLLQKQFSTSKTSTHRLLDKLDSGGHTLWMYLKRLQLASTDDRTLVLFFDQFEELFSYTHEEIEAFKNELYQATKVSVPAEIMKQISALRKESPELVTSETLKQLKQEMPIKLVFSIRTDRLAFLDQMVDRFRNIRSNFLELQPLSETGARDSILEPSQVEGNYASRKFNYEDAASTKILNFLSNNGEKSIESTQLQIVCQQIEKNEVIRLKKKLITELDLPNFEDIFRNFYLDAIANLEGEQKEKAEKLIETQLIRNEQRISLDEEVCKDATSQTPLLQSSLDTLVDARLLRREPNSFGRSSYELAHDTLIPPIIQIAEIKRLRDERDKKAEEKRLAFEAEQKDYKAKKGKRAFWTGVAIAVIAVLFSGVVTLLWLNANALRARAEKERAISEKQKQIAEAQTQNAEESAAEALEAGQIANSLRLQADSAREIAEIQTSLASKRLMESNRQTHLANLAKNRALEQEKLAKESNLRAQEATRSAINKAEIADRLRTQSLARSIAARSMDETNLETKALLSRQAWVFAEESGLNTFDPIIHKAGYLAYNSLSSNLFLNEIPFIRSITYDKFGKNYYIVTGDGKVYACDAGRNCNLLLNFNAPKYRFEALQRLIMSPNGKYLITISKYNLFIIDLTTDQLASKVSFSQIDPNIVFHPNGESIFISADHNLLRMKISNGALTQEGALEAPVRSMDISPSGDELSLISGNQLISVNLKNNSSTVKYFPEMNGANPTAVAYAPDENLLGIGLSDGGVRVYDKTNRSWTYTAYPHHAHVSKVQFSPDQTFLASVSWDKSVAISTIDNFTALPLRFDNITTKSGDIVFSPVDNHLLVSTIRGLKLIPLEIDTLMTEICGYISSNLSELEWVRNFGRELPYRDTCEDKPRKIE